MPRFTSTLVVFANTFGALALLVGPTACSDGEGITIPPIDAEAPEVFETATFALG